jgi:hypothetical protein
MRKFIAMGTRVYQTVKLQSLHGDKNTKHKARRAHYGGFHIPCEEAKE